MDYKMEELLPIVFELARKYTGGESTSITYEKAQTLMGAVLYCLNEYNSSNADSLACGDISVRKQYDIGVKLLFEKVENIRRIFNETAACFEDFGVKCLHDTVLKGIPQFLKWYDIKFCPQDTILTLDYPLLSDLSSMKGADAVYKYIRGIQIEQLFLGTFDRNYVISVLEKYNPGYQEMIENVCSIVLTNAVGHMAVQKAFDECGFSYEEYMKLSNVFGGKSAAAAEYAVKQFIREMINILYAKGRTGGEKRAVSCPALDSAEMMEYLFCEAENIAVRINTAAEYGQMERIFVL